MGGGGKKCFSVTRYGKKEWSVSSSSSSSSSSPGNSKPWNGEGKREKREREKFARFATKPGSFFFCNTTMERKGNGRTFGFRSTAPFDVLHILRHQRFFWRDL